MAQIIKVIVQLIDKFTKNAKKVETNMNGMGQKAKTLTTHSERLGRSTADLERGLNMQGIAINKNGQAYDMLTGRFVKLNHAMGKAKSMTNRFRMELLGVMFFGMMVQRIFLGMARSGVDAFMKITEGQTKAGQSIITLSAGWQYLQFAIGDAIGSALEPFMDTIIGIIEMVGDWIDRNTELVAGLIIVGAVVGTLMLAFGSFGLGITSTIIALGSATGGTGILGALAMIPLPVKIAAVALAVAAAFIIANWDAVGPAFKDTATALSKTFIDMEADLDTMNEAWDKAFDSWVEGGAVVMIRIAREVIQGMATMFNMVMAAFRWHIQVFLKGIIGPDAAKNFAEFAFPSVAGVAASPFLAQLDKWERDTLKRLHPPTTDRSFLKSQYQGLLSTAIMEQGTSMGENLGAFEQRYSGIGTAEDVVQAGGVKVETLNQYNTIDISETVASWIEGGKTTFDELTAFVNGLKTTGGIS